MDTALNKHSFTFSIIEAKEKYLSANLNTADDSWQLHQSALFDPSVSRIWLVLRGSGRAVTRFGTIDITENHAYFLPSNSIIATSLDESMVQFYIDFYQDPSEIAIEQLYTFNLRANPEKFQLLLQLAKSISPIYKQTDFLSQFMVSSTLTTILTHFVKDVSKSSKTLSAAIEYILDHYSQAISITYLANLCDYSPEYFSEKFKLHFGVSPQKFIILKRLAKAKFLLISTHKTIREIGEEVGYPDQIHFSKLFSKQIGISPFNYRKNFR